MLDSPSRLLPKQVRILLSSGRWDETRSAVLRLHESGNLVAAALGQLLLAARLHDGREILRISGSSDGDLLRLDLGTHRELSRTLFRTVGVQSAQPDLSEVLRRAVAQHVDEHEDHTLARLADSTSGHEVLESEGAPEVSLGFLSEQELPVITASVNGRSPEFFIIDTGASTSLLSLDYCRRAKILADADSVAIESGHAPPSNLLPLNPVFLESLELGPLRIRGWTANVTRFPPTIRVAGLLSPFDTFRKLEWELDFEMRRIVIRRIPSHWDTAQDWCYRTQLIRENGSVFVHGMVNGFYDGFFLVDTGAAGNLLTPEFSAHCSPAGRETPTIYSRDIHGDITIRKEFRGELVVGQSDPLNTDFFIRRYEHDPRDIAPLKCAGFIGLPWMNTRRILITPEATELRFTAAHSVSSRREGYRLNE